MRRPPLALAALAAALVLAGCASVAPDGLRGDVQSHVRPACPTARNCPRPMRKAAGTRRPRSPNGCAFPWMRTLPCAWRS